jgi:hypothetical protein
MAIRVEAGCRAHSRGGSYRIQRFRIVPRSGLRSGWSWIYNENSEGGAGGSTRVPPQSPRRSGGTNRGVDPRKSRGIYSPATTPTSQRPIQAPGDHPKPAVRLRHCRHEGSLRDEHARQEIPREADNGGMSRAPRGQSTGALRFDLRWVRSTYRQLRGLPRTQSRYRQDESRGAGELGRFRLNVAGLHVARLHTCRFESLTVPGVSHSLYRTISDQLPAHSELIAIHCAQRMSLVVRRWSEFGFRGR